MQFIEPKDSKVKNERASSLTHDDSMLIDKMRNQSITVRNMLREKFTSKKIMTESEKKKMGESSILAFNQNFL